MLASEFSNADVLDIGQSKAMATSVVPAGRRMFFICSRIWSARRADLMVDDSLASIMRVADMVPSSGPCPATRAAYLDTHLPTALPILLMEPITALSASPKMKLNECHLFF